MARNQKVLRQYRFSAYASEAPIHFASPIPWIFPTEPQKPCPLVAISVAAGQSLSLKASDFHPG